MTELRPPWLQWINPQPHVVWQGTWRPRHVEATRFLADHELVLFTRGHCHVELGKQRFRCEPGSYLIVPPNFRHMTVAGQEPVTRCCIHFDWTPQRQAAAPPTRLFGESPLPASIVRPAPRFVPRGPLAGGIPQNRPIASLTETMIARWSAGGALNRAACRATLMELLLMLLGEQPNPSLRRTDRSLDLAMRVKWLLDDARGDRPNLPQLLRPLGYSYEHLCRVFAQAFGTTPLRYLNLQRLERAKLLLRDPSLSVAAVAHAAGFDDPNYFSRAFRRHTGRPPTRYSELLEKPELPASS